MGKVEKVVALVDGATYAPRGGGNSKVMSATQEVLAAEVSEDLVKRLQAGDPYSSRLFSLVSSEEASEAPAAGGYDPADYPQDQVLDYLSTASAEEVSRVQKAEASGKDRKKIAAFESSGGGVEAPVPEYDSLDVAQVIAVITANAEDEEFVQKVKAYEAANQNRDEIVNLNIEAATQAEVPNDQTQSGSGPEGGDGS